MKRWLLYLTLMAFLLIGCQAPSDTSTTAPSESAEASTETSTESFEAGLTIKPAIITITINPTWEIHLDQDALISEVVSLNEDAQDLLLATNIVGMPLSDGLTLLFDQAQSKGYLEEGDTIQFQLDLTNASSSQTMAQTAEIHLLIQKYLDTHNLDDIQVSSTWVDDTPEYDHITSNDGHNPETYYSNGMIEKEIHYIDGCTITTHYSEQGPTHSLTLCPDGTYIMTKYHANGVESLIERHDIDGTITATSFYPNGNIEDMRIDHPDGQYELSTFLENGLNNYTRSFDGSETYITYHDNGIMASSETFRENVIIMKFTYDLNGRETYQYFIDDEGKTIEYIYNTDYSYTITAYLPNGKVHYIEYVDANDKVIGGVDIFGQSYTVDQHGFVVYDEE